MALRVVNATFTCVDIHCGHGRSAGEPASGAMGPRLWVVRERGGKPNQTGNVPSIAHQWSHGIGIRSHPESSASSYVMISHPCTGFSYRWFNSHEGSSASDGPDSASVAATGPNRSWLRRSLAVAA